jgi:GTPase
VEKVITVGLYRSSKDLPAMRASLAELARLVETAGGEVVEVHHQRADAPHPATFVGKGKAEELRLRAEALGVQTIVFDDELRPAQQRNLDEASDLKIVDRTRLILDIFAQRARTREGILQVELAQLQYLLPRITEKFGRFEQQTGGIGTRGPGERKLEVDQRRIRERISRLKSQIEKIRGERALQRRVRRSVPIPQVALVGYTNAGKSTLLNALLRGSHTGTPHRPVYADNKLFATLDPTTRRVRLPSGRIILFSDTVGFIQKLPTELVAAFRATLEEAGTADLLLHVIDGAHPQWETQERVVLEILRELKMEALPRLAAYNKIDLLPTAKRDILSRREGILVSAAAGEGIDLLLQEVEMQLSHQWVEKEVLLPFSDGARLAQLHELTNVLSEEVTEKGIKLRIQTHPATWMRWEENRKP